MKFTDLEPGETKPIPVIFGPAHGQTWQWDGHQYGCMIVIPRPTQPVFVEPKDVRESVIGPHADVHEYRLGRVFPGDLIGACDPHSTDKVEYAMFHYNGCQAIHE